MYLDIITSIVIWTKTSQFSQFMSINISIQTAVREKNKKQGLCCWQLFSGKCGWLSELIGIE